MECVVVILFFLAIFFIPLIHADTKALIVVPVADMLLHKAGNKELYALLPCMGEQGCRGCARIHQCLFNETVDIIAYDGDEVCVSIKNSFYGYNSTKTASLTYMWTLRDNIIPYQELEKDTPIPASIDYAYPQSIFDQDVVTLLLPWYDFLTKRSYSVGTRFKRIPIFDNTAAYAVAFLDAINKECVTAFIPRTHATAVQKKDKKITAALFVAILEKWIDCAGKKKGLIPYVWGGSSFVHIYTDNPPTLEKRWHFATPVMCWLRKEPYIPTTGFDCSELILRAAQIAGMPYFFKNSSTMASNMRPLTVDEHIEVGDLIWVPGHVMVVSSIKDNQIIEAAGYHKEYGDIHILPLSAIFDGIKNIAELKQAYHAKNSVNIKDKKGKIIETHQHCIIFKLTSIFDSL
jgi:cell wall-associated NlpC family hydrolase